MNISDTIRQMSQSNGNTMNNYYSAEEIDVEKLSLNYQPCNMYILVTMYHVNKQAPQFVRINGTDFTESSCFRPPIDLPDHCRLNDNRTLTQNQTILVEQNAHVFRRFTEAHNLEPATDNPTKSVYEKKLIIEVKGQIKRYNNMVNYQKTSIKLLTKNDVLYKIRKEKDRHLAEFFQRLIKNCPTDWKFHLNHLYGVNELLDDIEFYQTQNHYGFETQDTKLPEVSNLPVFRLLNEKPDANTKSVEPKSDYIHEVMLRIKQESFDTSYTHVQLVEKPPITNVSDHSTDTVVSDEIDSSDNDMEYSDALSTQALSTPHFQVTNENVIVEKSVPVFETTAEDHQRDEMLPDTHQTLFACGFSPRISEDYLITNEETKKLEITDSFEIYFTLTKDDPVVHTLCFRTSADVEAFLFNSNIDGITDESDEQQLKHSIASRFSKGQCFELPKKIYRRYQVGEEHIQFSQE